jgi:hypothetical protein
VAVDRKGVLEINGENREYRRGMTMGEYTPWMKHLKQSSTVTGMEASDYLNRLDVRRSLNIPDSIQPWESCVDSKLNYKCLEEGSYWLYPILKNKLRILIISGDTDGCVPYSGTLSWIK